MTPGEPDTGLAFLGPNQRNKLHKPEDPRGWSEEEKASRGHQYADSGVGLRDTGRTPHSQTRDSTTIGGDYDSNKAAVSQNREAVPSTTAATTSGTPDYRGGESKPGVMAGAYSRLDNSNTNNQYPQSTSQDPTNKSHASTTGVGAVGAATGIASAASSSNTADNESDSSVRNVVRNGLRQSSDLDHTDPYWGDVPHGTGVYNTVTGHGSSETPVHGSIQARDSQLSHDQQRTFPLATSDAHTQDETSPPSSSRFREVLAEPGAGAGVGIDASELAEKHSERKHENEVVEPTTRKHESAEPKKESKIASLFHRDHKDEDTKHEKKHEAKEEKKLTERGPAKDDKPLTDRDAGAALAAATMAYGAKDHTDKHGKKNNEYDTGLGESNTDSIYKNPNEKVADRSAPGTTTQPQQASDPFIAAGYTGLINQPPTSDTGNKYPASSSATTRDHPHTSQAAEKSTQHDDSRAGYGLAAAGAGAGAGYAAHKYGNRDGDTYKESVTEPSYNSQTTSSKTAPQQADTGYTIGQPRLAVMTGSSGAPRSSETRPVPPTTSSSVNPSQGGATHHDKYSALSDGTPSGIDIGNHYGDKKDVVPTSTSSSAASNTTPKDSYSGAKATAAGVGAAGAGTAAYYSGKRNNDMSTIHEARQPVAPSSKKVREPYMEGATSRDTITSTQGGQRKPLPTSTSSGINLDDSRHQKSVGITSSSSPTTSRYLSNDDTHNNRGAKAAAVAGVAGTGAAATATHHRDSEKNKGGVAASDFATGKPAATPRTADTSIPDSTRKSTDSSHGGQYNVLSSGTPSGINIDHHGDAKNTTSTAVPTGTTARSVELSSSVHPTAASAPKKSNIPKPAAVATGAAAAAAATGPSMSSGDKVFHRCRACGEQNDITGYFQEKKH